MTCGKIHRYLRPVYYIGAYRNFHQNAILTVSTIPLLRQLSRKSRNIPRYYRYHILTGSTDSTHECYSRKMIMRYCMHDFHLESNKMYAKIMTFLNRGYNTVINNEQKPINFNPKPAHPSATDHVKYLDANDNNVVVTLSNDFIVYDDFITQDEEQSLVEEIESHMKRLKYQFDHWDDAIQGYREIERKQWREANNVVLERMRTVAFSDGSQLLPHVHVLDIAKDGYIKPHVDSKRFCGNTVAGLSLLSPSVMRLMLDSDRTKYADILLSQRSYYVMTNRARYDYTHEILEDGRSKFKGQHVPRDRRISVMLRNLQTEDSGA